MEIGSGSLTDSGSSKPDSSSPSHESINGLKFGQKIYFEDVAVAPLAASKPGPGSSPSSSPGSRSGSGPPGRKVHGGGGQGQGQPPRCQVEGCKVDLSDAKTYYWRHKVCGMHSKSPVVIVAGLEQRFCQQCSRFHQLPEFDQGKRSCRRRLAGHNERRRKPPPGSLLSSFRHGRLPSTVFDSSNRATGFLLDFSTYPRLTGRDSWPTARSSGNQTVATGRSIPHTWQSSLQNPPSNLYLQVSAGGAGYPSSGIPSGECFTDGSVADSSCALSLLSNQSLGSSNRAPDLRVNDLVNAEGVPGTQTTAQHGAAINQYPNPSWGFKFNEAGSSSHAEQPDLVLGHISQPLDGQFSGELELSQQGRRQYMELEHSRAYGTSTQQLHWSL